MWVLTGLLFTSVLYSQSNDDAGLYAIWSDTTKPGVDRIDAYFDKLNHIELFGNEQNLDDKWFAAADKAIELALKFDKKEYLPLFYLASSFNYGLLERDIECGCMEAEKVIESAKLANASKFPVITAYMILFNACSEVIKDEAFINEFNKVKSTLSDTPEDLKMLQELNSTIGNLYISKDQYPKALKHLQESAVSRRIKFNRRQLCTKQRNACHYSYQYRKLFRSGKVH
jgi:hypothetical protein